MLASLSPVGSNGELVGPDACVARLAVRVDTALILGMLVCPVFRKTETTVGSELVWAEVTTLEPVNELDEACVSVVPELTTSVPALIGMVDSKVMVALLPCVTVATDWLVWVAADCEDNRIEVPEEPAVTTVEALDDILLASLLEDIEEPEVSTEDGWLTALDTG